MSGHESTYEPKTGIEKWIDARLPVPRLVYDSFVDFPTPKNLNYWWTFGGILAIFLAIQIATGVVLAMHYTATTADAFASVERIMRDVVVEVLADDALRGLEIEWLARVLQEAQRIRERHANQIGPIRRRLSELDGGRPKALNCSCDRFAPSGPKCFNATRLPGCKPGNLRCEFGHEFRSRTGHEEGALP